MTDRRTFLAALPALAGIRLAGAQSRPEPAKIGFLFAAAPAAVAARIDAFRAGLATLGYSEGRQVVFEIRYAHGDVDRLPALAAELVAIPVSVIVSGGSSATRPAANATATIPIVMGQDNDPVASGVVASFARPGGNVTGLATLTPDLSAKQVALLVELVPGLKRFAILGDSGEPGNGQTVAEAERAASRLQLQTQYVDSRKGLPQMFAATTQWRAGGALVLQSAYMFARLREISDLAVKARLPALYANPEFVRQGGLATYGVDAVDLFRRAAEYVAKILNGAKPADLPVEQPRTFDFLINRSAAWAIGVTIPQALLLRANEVLE